MVIYLLSDPERIKTVEISSVLEDFSLAKSKLSTRVNISMTISVFSLGSVKGIVLVLIKKEEELGHQPRRSSIMQVKDELAITAGILFT